jgi:osmotically inducible lipoprotein OsmB
MHTETFSGGDAPDNPHTVSGLQESTHFSIGILFMKNIARLAKPLTALLLLPVIMACTPMSHRQQNTAVGAGVGAVAGSILTGGSTIGTLGGAAIGGVIGNGTDGRSRRR